MAAVLRIGGEHESELKLSYPLNFRVMSDGCERLSECQWLTENVEGRISVKYQA